jgi:hypothetical protein
MKNIIYCKNSLTVSRNIHDKEDVMLVSRSSKPDYYLLLTKVGNNIIGPVQELKREDAFDKVNNFSDKGGTILLFGFSDKREAREFIFVRKGSQTNIEKPLYVEENDSINKYSFSFENNGDFRSLLNKIFEHEMNSNRAYVSFSELINNKQLYSLVKHPVTINPSYDVFIPEFGYDSPSLYYVLSGLSNDSRDNINLGYKELERINKATNEDNREFVDQFLSFIKVTKLESLDKNDFMKFLEDFEKYGDKTNVIISHELTIFKNILESSQKNKELIDRLGLLKKKEEKKDDKKTLTI